MGKTILSFRNLVIIAVMAICCLFLYIEYGLSIGLLKYAILLILLLAACIVDLKSGKIPDKVVLAGILTGIVFSAINGPKDVAFKLISGIIAALLLLLISWLSKGGVGMGDVKLAAFLGVYLGLGMTISVLSVSVILSGIAAAVILLSKKAGKNGTIPFAPFILLGTVILMFLG